MWTVKMCIFEPRCPNHNLDQASCLCSKVTFCVTHNSYDCHLMMRPQISNKMFIYEPTWIKCKDFGPHNEMVFIRLSDDKVIIGFNKLNKDNFKIEWYECDCDEFFVIENAMYWLPINYPSLGGN